jgi:hypothetical protein
MSGAPKQHGQWLELGLSRPTFYRRLKRGVELLADELFDRCWLELLAE